MILKIEQHVNRKYMKYVVRMRNTQFYVRGTDNLNHTMFAWLVHALNPLNTIDLKIDSMQKTIHVNTV